MKRPGQLERVCGAVLALLREQSGRTQSQVGRSIGVPQSVISRVEDGKIAIRVDRLDAHARAVGSTGSAVLARAERIVSTAGKA